MSTSPQRQLIGALLLRPDQLPCVIDLVDPRDFTNPDAASVYFEMLRLHRNGGFSQESLLNRCLGDTAKQTLIVQIMAECRTCSDVMIHVRGVLDQSLRRRLRLAIADLVELADAEEVTPEEVRTLMEDMADWVPTPFNRPSESVSLADFVAQEDEDG